MKRNYLTVIRKSIISMTYIIISIVCTIAQDKISAEDILTKHLNSIGTAESRAATKTMMLVGTSKASSQGRGTGLAEGIVVLASEGEKNLIGMKFNNADYPFEMMAYDGNRFSARQIRPGTRSILGNFLRLNEFVFKNGIMGGTLSLSWILLNFDEKKGKIKFVRVQKIGDKQLYKLNYSPKKGGDLDINFFFDAETFRHVRTEYRLLLSSQIGKNPDSSAQQNETRYTMNEDFSDFKTENKLNLPHNYRLFLEIISGNGTVSYEWKMELQNFIFNQPIEHRQFDVDTY